MTLAAVLAPVPSISIELTSVPVRVAPAAPGVEQAAREAAGVVMLFASTGPRQISAGTGIVLTTDGVALTNAHVVRDARQIIAHDSDGDYVASVLGADSSHDIAVVKLATPGRMRPALLGDSARIRVGQRVSAVGNVAGSGQATVDTGVITALDRDVVSRDANGSHPEQLRHMLETDAWVRPGDSGGPLLSAGRVIGVNTSADGRHGYAIAINDALTYAHTLARFPEQRRQKLDQPRRAGRAEPETRASGKDQPVPRRPDRHSLLTARLQLGSGGPHRHRQPSHPPRRRPLAIHAH